jgi:hypothetical protein
MIRSKALNVTLAAALSLGMLGAACDDEDKRDADEIGNDIEKGVDNLDQDGKDD